MLIIPIGHGQGVARWPYLTFIIIGINVAVFLLTFPAALIAHHNQYQIQESQWGMQQRLEYEENQLRWELYWEYDKRHPDAFDGTTLDQKMDRFWELALSGRAFPAGSSEDRRIQDLQQQKQQAALMQPQNYQTEPAFDPYKIFGFTPKPFRLHTLITSMFMHGGVFHLLGNMLILFLVAPPFEDRYGRMWLAILYLAGGIAASLGYYAFNMNSSTPCVGASGAIAALMGMALVRFPLVKIRFWYFFWFYLRIYTGTKEVPVWFVLPLWIVLQITYFTGIGEEATGIALSAHITGFFFGVFVALVIRIADFEKHLTPEEVKEFDRHLEPEPTFESSLKITGLRGLVNSHRYREAIHQLNEALEKEPGEPRAQAMLCVALAGDGREQEAGDQINGALNSYLRSDMLANADILLQELDSYDLDLTIDPLLRYKLASMFERAGNLERAALHFAELQRKSPQSTLAPKALVAAANIYSEKINDPHTARSIYNKLISEYPASPQASQAKRLMTS